MKYIAIEGYKYTFTMWLHSTPCAISETRALLLSDKSIALVAVVGDFRLKLQARAQNSTMNGISWLVAS